MSEPREFWIAMCTFNDGYTEIYECRDGEFEPTPPSEKVHVIEKSAYDALAKECEELKIDERMASREVERQLKINNELREALRVAIKALIFCSKIHYSEEFNNHGCMATATITDVADKALENLEKYK